MSLRPAVALALLAALLLSSFALPAQDKFRRNQFGPTGAMCRAACGPDCPDTCRRTRYPECASPSIVRMVDRYTCGTHQGCRDHDFCLDNCAARGVGQTGVDFYIAQCNRECHELTVGRAMNEFGRVDGLNHTRSWAGGGGPYSGEMTWEYTKDEPYGRERLTRCPACSTCMDGMCVVSDDEQCEPCQSCGDVHIRSLDGLRYDFQSSGDFILVDSPDGTRVEARQVPRGRGVSVNSAVAVRLDGQVVRVWLRPEPGVDLDGQALDGPSSRPMPLGDGGELHWRPDSVLLRGADGWRASVRIFGNFLNIAVVPPSTVRGQLRGLLGNADGDPDNDLVGHDGTAYGVDLDVDALYDGFGASWRLHPEQSLLAGLPWPDSLAMTGSGRPASIATLASLDPQLRWEAGMVCADAGLEDQPNFDACVLDYAMTGDPEMIDSAILSAHGQRDLQSGRSNAGSQSLAVGEVAIEGPGEALAGARIEVAAFGDIDASDRIALVPLAATDARHINSVRVGEAEGAPLSLLVPPEPGAYRLAYLRYPSDEERDAHPFQVQPVQVALQAPARVHAGSRVEVALDGEGHPSDLLVITLADAAPTHMGSHARRGREDRVAVLAPSHPGSYELRYLIDQRRHLVARQPIEVTPLRVALDAPDATPAGGPLTVVVVGESNPTDLVVVVPSDAPDDAMTLHARLGRDARQVQFRNLPDTPGSYEIRYLIDRGRVVAARRALRIDPSTP